MTYDYDRAARDQEANEWSLAIKAEKYEKAVRAGHGTKEEMQALREKDAKEAAERQAREKQAVLAAAEQEAKRRDEQFAIHQEEQRKWLGDDE